MSMLAKANKVYEQRPEVFFKNFFYGTKLLLILAGRIQMSLPHAHIL
jgi:hypothetical protein